jgi:hypothetical protein
MVEHKYIRSQALGEVVADTCLLSTQEVSHGVVCVSCFCPQRQRRGLAISHCLPSCFVGGRNALRDVISATLSGMQGPRHVTATANSWDNARGSLLG